MIFQLALVILFILRITPGNISLTRKLINNYGRPVLLLLRKVEKCQLKIIKTQLDIEFLNTCINYHLYPKFLNFKLSIRRLHGSHLQRQFQRKILFNELAFKKSRHKSVLKEFDTSMENLRKSISFLTFYQCKKWLECKRDDFYSRTKIIHNKKLETLGFNSIKHPPIENVIFNYSNRVLTDIEKSALAVGLDFTLTTGKIKAVNHFTPFEVLVDTIDKSEMYRSTPERKSIFLSNLKHIAHSTFENINNNRLPPNLPKNQLKALKDLSKDENIVILKPDKGNGIVLLNKQDYINKVNVILDDSSKFEIVDNTALKLIHKLESKIRTFLGKLKKDKIITENTYNNLSPTGSRPGILYGLPKVHKIDVPLRPILSSIKTPSYNMSKYLVPLISPMAKNEFTVQDSFSFAKEIHNYKCNNSDILASFDIKSLYTNIPLIETINIIIDLIFENNNIFNLFNKVQFKKFLEITLLDTYFFFNKKLYKQVDGLAMGSPIAPILANIFLCFHEKKWLNDCPVQFKPKLYRRYMDDSFLVFSDTTHVDLFLNYLNNKHPNIKFTKEIENNGHLPFLDINIKKENNSLSTSVYRKNTFTGLCMNFNSFAPFIYKINLIKTLIFRSFSLSSSYFNMHLDFVKVKSFLVLNGFKSNIIDKYIKSFLGRIYNSPKPPIDSVNKHTLFIKLPFHGEESFKIRRNLHKLFSKFYPQIKLNVVFQSGFRIKNMFRFKDTIPTPLRSSLVYKYVCSRCNSVYIGKTSRHISTRICEHLGISYRTTMPLTNPPFSAIRNHTIHNHNNYTISPNEFTIVESAQTDFQLLKKESILIKQIQPNLNNMESLTLKIY